MPIEIFLELKKGLRKNFLHRQSSCFEIKALSRALNQLYSDYYKEAFLKVRVPAKDLNLLIEFASSKVEEISLLAEVPRRLIWNTSLRRIIFLNSAETILKDGFPSFVCQIEKNDASHAAGGVFHVENGTDCSGCHPRKPLRLWSGSEQMALQ